MKFHVMVSIRYSIVPRAWLFALVLCVSAHAQGVIPSVFDLKALRGIPTPNVLMPGSMAIDPWRGLVYVSAPQQRIIVVFPIASDLPQTFFPFPPDLPRDAKLIGVNPRTRHVLAAVVRDTGATLYSIDPLRGIIARQFDDASAGRLSVQLHPDSNALFVSTGRRHILELDGVTLRAVDSIDVGFPAGELFVDSTGGRLWIAQAGPVLGLTGAAVISTITFEVTQTYSYASEDVLDRIAADPKLQRFALIGTNTVHLFDEFGVPLRTFDIGGSIAGVAYERITHRMLLLDRPKPGECGRRTLYRFSLADPDADSMTVGINASDLTVFEATHECALLNRGASSVDVFYAPDRSLRRTVPLGQSIESLAFSEDGRRVFATNAGGSGNTITSIDLVSAATMSIRVGDYPILLLLSANRDRIYALTQFEGMLKTLDPDFGFVMDSLRIRGMATNRTDLIPAMALSNDDTAIVRSPATRNDFLLDLRTPRILRVIPFSEADTGTSPFPVQCAFLGGRSSYAISIPGRGSIAIGSFISGMPLEEHSLKKLDSSRFGPFSRMWLRTGIREGEIFLGPYRSTPPFSDFDSIPFPGAGMYLGRDAAGTYYALFASGDECMLVRSSHEDFSFLTPTRLSIPCEGLSAVAFDSSRKRLALGYSASAHVYVYDLSSLPVSIEILPRTSNITVAPNPVHLEQSCRVTIEIPQTDLQSAIIHLTDLFGRTVRTLTADSFHGVRATLTFISGEISPGVYLLSCTTKRVQHLQKIIFLK